MLVTLNNTVTRINTIQSFEMFPNSKTTPFVLVNDNNDIVKVSQMKRSVASGLNHGISQSCDTISWEEVILAN